MRAAREWRLDQLLDMFPDVSRGTDRMLRCLLPIAGSGRFIQDKAGVHISATVSLTATPADRFRLRCSYPWPRTLRAEQRKVIQSRLLRGILEGTIMCEDPPWRCHLECTGVAWFPKEGVAWVQEAASLAVQDLVERGAWEAVGGPGDNVA
jgi:hypothetical protein